LEWPRNIGQNAVTTSIRTRLSISSMNATNAGSTREPNE